ncbi:putative PEP-binding protein [Hoeflea marina]|nr:putative PEP-binding protein [Hoeflea marina]
MPDLIRLSGRTASPGFAAGPIHIVGEARTSYRPLGSAEAEEAALRQAVAAAAEATADSMRGLDEEAASIIEFQLAMLEDDTFVDASLARIQSGVTAFNAWAKVLDLEVEDYRASDDPYFQARSADLADIRDRVLDILTGAVQQPVPPGAIQVATDMSPSHFLAQDWDKGGGLALRAGSVSSHVSMLARSRGIPALVGIGFGAVPDLAAALLDAESGVLLIHPDEISRTQFDETRGASRAAATAAGRDVDRPASTADGEAVAVMVNIAQPGDVGRIPIGHCDGVGLMRTEFLFGGTHGLPDEATQLDAYLKVLVWAAGKPVTIRSIDAGGDKPVEGLTIAEDNPFLGMRGIRLSLAKPEIFRVQIRALLRAAPRGALKVMLPMVSVPGEIDSALALFAEEAEGLAGRGIAHAMPEIGIMVEVPSVAVTPERFFRAAFLSIGSNDLTQYVLAASRDNAALGALSSAADPAVLRLIGTVAAHGAAAGIEVSLCGDAASDPKLVPLLLAAGLRRLSVAPAQLAAVKAAVRAWSRTSAVVTEGES